MYFHGIGASGFVMGAIKTVSSPHGGGLALRYAALMQELRDAIDVRIRLVLSDNSRAIATAFLTGRRDAITTPVNEAMFISGLGHVLSISGYHMAVVAGVVFFAVRALLAGADEGQAGSRGSLVTTGSGSAWSLEPICPHAPVYPRYCGP